MNLKRVSAYFSLHAKSYLRSRSALFFQIAFPVILILLFGAIFSNSGYSPTTLQIQNESPSPLSWDVVNAINESGLFKVHIISESENLSKYIQGNSVSAVLLIPSNFTSNFYDGKSIVILEGHEDPTTASAVYQALSGVLTQINFRIDNSTERIVLDSKVAIGNSGKAIDYYVPGLIGFTVLSTMFNMVYTVPNYRKEKIFRQLSFSGLTKSEWIMSNMLFSFLLLVVSDIILVVIGIYVFEASLVINLDTVAITAVILFGGLMFFTSLGILAGMVSDNEETVSVVGNLIMFPMMFLSGVFFPLTFAPAYLTTISKFLPLTYFINSLIYVLDYGQVSSSLIEVLFLLIGSVILFAISVVLFSWKQR
ncbi:MAG: ABC transporter permease [Thermoplasmatales archaeon]